MDTAKKLIIVFIAIFGLIFLLEVFFVLRDSIALNTYIEGFESDLDDNDSYSTAHQVQQFVAHDLDCRAPFEMFNIMKRPFKGYDLYSILKFREGQCGEGVKLIFRILKKFDIESRRIYLFGEKSMHALLEIQIENEWYLLDTINSPLGDIPDSTSIDEIFTFQNARFNIITNEEDFFGKIQYSYLSVNRLIRRWKVAVFVYKPLPCIVNDYLLTDYRYEMCFFGGVTLVLVFIRIFVLRASILRKSEDSGSVVE